jgi:DNA polymerase
LHKSRTHAVPGEGARERAEVMLIGEAPGQKEDETARPFVGMTGRRFFRPLLERLGFEMSDLFITSVVKCRPPNNRDPGPEEVETCVNAWLKSQIEALDPKELMLLGKVPAKGLLGLTKKISDLRGGSFTVFGRPARVTYHPTAGMRFPKPRKALEQDLAELGKRMASDTR